MVGSDLESTWFFDTWGGSEPGFTLFCILNSSFGHVASHYKTCSDQA